MRDEEPVMIERIGKSRRVLHFHDGRTVSECNHANGVASYRVRRLGRDKDGLSEYWWPNGKMMCRENYRRGKLHGVLETWKDDGTASRHEQYSNGKRVNA